MSDNGKKIICSVATLMCLFVFSGCGNDNVQYSLTYTAAENGSIKGPGTQTVSHDGAGAMVTAVPENGYHFVGWSDGVTTPGRTDSKVTKDLAVTASFAVNQYTLTYTAEENGAIEGAGKQIVSYDGAGAMVTAVPENGYHFVGWSDGVTTPGRTDSKVTKDLAVTASFAVNQYTLTYTAEENGVIEGASPQTVLHGGDGGAVTAVPAEHYHFAGWSDRGAAAQRLDRGVTTDLKLTATFAIDQYALTYAAEENGTIAGDKSQKIDYGGGGRPVTAAPAVGYHFVSWSDGVTTPGRTDTRVTEDLAVTASFAVNQYTLTYTAGENGAIKGASPQIVDHGGKGSAVMAIASAGYHFVSWSDGITTAQRLDSNVAENLAVSAVFAVNAYSIGGRVTGLVEGAQVVLQNKAGDDLAITANGDFNFAAELLNADTYEVRVLSQPTSPNQICTMTGGAGTVSGEDVTDIVVTCILKTYTIGGTVSGLPDGDLVVLRNNDVDDLVISANGTFTFAKPLDDHSEYKVTVYNQPKRPNWNCTVKEAAGTLTGREVIGVVVDCYPKVVLQIKAGVRKVKLDWNSEDFSEEETVNLCRAREKVPSGMFGDCLSLKKGVLETVVDNPHTVSPLTSDIPYWFQMEVQYPTGRQTLSQVVSATPFSGLNDTGIDWCADDTTNRNVEGTKKEKDQSCLATPMKKDYPGQDALYGRDMMNRVSELSKTGSGSAGFDFTKVCMSGETAGEGECPPNPSLGSGANNWACILDNVTGLVWEVKSADGLHSQGNSYSWYNPDKTKNGGEPGVQNGGSCKESLCDTQAFVQAVNTLGLCGAKDWRLPTRKELLSILDNGRFSPAIDTRYFPNSQAVYYWSSSPFTENADYAWEVHFKYGEADTNKKNERNSVRLVRGRTVTFGLKNP